jgi:hypothetical protein
VADRADAETALRLFTEVREALGQIDALVSFAGLKIGAPPFDKRAGRVKHGAL